MRFIFVFIGCFFIFDPSYNLIDVFPDFIGIILIMLGISRASDLDAHTGTSFVRFKNALFVSLAKFACFVLSLTGFFDSTMTLTFSFVFGVLECVFLIPAFSSLFDGMAYLAPGGNGSAGGEVSALTSIFLVARAVGSSLPGIFGLIAGSSGGDVVSGGMSAAQISTLLGALSALCVFVFGVVWLTFVSKPVFRLSKDKELCSALFDRYKKEILGNEEIMLSRRTKRFTNLFSASALFTLTLKAEEIFFVPEFAIGVIMMIALFAAKDLGKKTRLKICLAALSLVGVAEYILLLNYSTRYGDAFEPFADKSFLTVYIPFAAFAVVFYILFSVCGFGVCKILREMTDKTVGLRGKYTDERRRETDEETKKSMHGKIGALRAAVVVYSLVGIVWALALPVARALWLLRLACGIVLCVLAFYVSHKISQESESTV